MSDDFSVEVSTFGPLKSRGLSVAVGDVNSDARGSGARYNAGKPPLGLVPVRDWIDVFKECEGCTEEILEVLLYLSDIQEGNAEAAFFPIHPNRMVMAARVFEYGAIKYAEWNWTKGMPWSIPIDCALRHLYAKLVKGEQDDPESGLPHMGHVYCNLVMLKWFIENYPEGENSIPSTAFSWQD